MRGEGVVHQFGEVLLQQPGDGERQPCRHQRGAFLEHVVAGGDGANDGGVGGGAPDLQFLQFRHERGLGVAGRGFGLVPSRLHLLGGEFLTRDKLRQPRLLVIAGGVVVSSGDVGLQEAVERDGAARCGQLDAFHHARPRLNRRGGGGGDGDADLLPLRIGHLRREGAHPDQLVKAMGVAGQTGGVRMGEDVTRGPDGLVGLLSVFHLRGIDARFRRQVAGPKQLLNLVAGRCDGGVRQGDGVGSHVGDEALLVELLGHRHGALRREAEFPASLLLEGGGAERLVGTAGVRLGLHLVDTEHGGLEGRGECGGGGLVQDCDRGAGGLPGGVEVAALGDAHPVEGGQARREGAGIGFGAAVEDHVEVPVAGGHESDAFPFPVDDETGGHGLHAARRQFRHDLLPQHRGDLVAVEAVEDAASLLRVDEIGIELAGVGDRLGDGRRRDLVEDHAMGGHLGFEFLQQVPRDGLTLAVTIGC